MNQKPKFDDNGYQSQSSNFNKLNQQQGIQYGTPQQFNSHFNSQIENYPKIKSCNQNSSIINDQVHEKLKLFENKNENGHFYSQDSNNPLNRDNLCQPQPKIKVQQFSSQNSCQNNQILYNQQQRQNNSFHQSNNQDGRTQMNQQQYFPTPQQNTSNNKIKIIKKIQDQNLKLIELDNKPQILDNNANISNPSYVIDENLFKRIPIILQQTPKEVIPKIDQSLFQRTVPNICKNTENTTEDINNSSFQQLQMNTIFKTKIINCFYCRNSIHNLSIGLDCQHFYHKECYNEINQQQINAGKGFCSCLCNKKIPQKQLQKYLPLSMIDKFFTNQSNQIMKQYLNLINMGKLL